MKRGAILCLISVLLLSGCGVFRYFDGSSDQEVKEISMSKEELQREVESLQTGNESLRKVVGQQESRIEKFEEKDKANLKTVSERQIRIESLEKEKNALLEENKTLKAAAAIKEVTLVEQPIREKAPAAIKEVTLVEQPTRKKAPAVPAKGLRIKVLAGSGGLSAARKMSKTLQDLGYKVERLDRASTAHFKSDTVYYAKDSEKEAGELAGRLGQGIVVKPLTWPSVFDIIVLTR
jgi:TolA-binding protein